MAQKIIQMPIWVWYALMIIIGLMFVFLTYGVFSGKDERQTINTNVGLLFGNISQILTELKNIVQELKNGQLQSQNTTQTLLPALERLFIQTNTIENNTNVTKTLVDSFGPDSKYLGRENQQYNQANNSFAHMNKTFEEIKRLLNSSSP